MALECKAFRIRKSTARKRINKEIGKMLKNWVGRFGADLIVPAGAIQEGSRQATLRPHKKSRWYLLGTSHERSQGFYFFHQAYLGRIRNNTVAPPAFCVGLLVQSGCLRNNKCYCILVSIVIHGRHRLPWIPERFGRQLGSDSAVNRPPNSRRLIPDPASPPIAVSITAKHSAPQSQAALTTASPCSQRAFTNFAHPLAAAVNITSRHHAS